MPFGFAAQQAHKQPSQLDIADLDASLVAAFLDHLERERANGVRTRNARLAAVHSLFRYEQRSTLVTTNLSFSEWVQVFGDEKLTTALLDRLGHHGHILTTRGQSFRTRRRQDSHRP